MADEICRHYGKKRSGGVKLCILRFYKLKGKSEAWLLPFWDRIQELAKYKKSPPSGKPEQVNHHKPPSKHIQEIFELGNRSCESTK